MEDSLKRLITKVFLKKGDKVRVTRGKYKGVTGTVDWIKRGRVFVFFDEPIPSEGTSLAYLLGRSFFPEEIEIMVE